MNQILIAAGLLAASSMAAMAAPVPLCSASTGINVNNLAAGCVAGPYLFDNFHWNDANGFGGGPVTILSARPGSYVSSIDLVFGTALGSPSSSVKEDLHFTFRVSTLNGQIGRASCRERVLWYV